MQSAFQSLRTLGNTLFKWREEIVRMLWALPQIKGKSLKTLGKKLHQVSTHVRHIKFKSLIKF